jgi:Cu(I)/Ag(I) efflux system protein CusF
MSSISRPAWAAVLTVLALLSGGAQAAEEWVSGIVRRIDLDQQKITVQHDEIRALQMPPMRMVFRVRSPEILQGLSVGDKIEFVAIEQAGAYLILKTRKNQ